MAYYYISYYWRGNGSTWQMSDTLIDCHPLEWLARIRKIAYESKRHEQYSLCFWKEITFFIYGTYKDKI